MDKYFVYVLISKKDGKLYVGCSKNPTSRLEAHNSGSVASTQRRKPFVLIHTEIFEKKADAFNRERFLKSLWGARTKNKIRETYLKNNMLEF